MRGAFLFAAMLASGAQAQPVTVPSGQDVEYVNVVRDARGSRGLTWRFRFVAPDIDRASGQIDHETAMKDMDFLCQNFAIERLPNIGPRPNQVIISLSSQPIDFGASDPEITQFFEVYGIVDNDCIWEPF